MKNKKSSIKEKDAVVGEIKNDTYNYGIDVLKIIATLMIVVMHVLGRGGVIAGCKVGSANYYIVWILECVSYVGVNLYALGTGYLNVNKKSKTSSFIKRWLQVLFYTVGFTAVFAIFMPGVVSLKSWVKAFIPVLTNHYWYFTAYFVLFMAMPYLNKLINALDKKELKKLVLVILFVFSFIPMIRQYDIFLTGHGFSAIWLITLYIVGAYLAICKDDLKYSKKSLWLVIVLSYLVAILGKYGVDYLNHVEFSNIETSLFLIDYTSVPIVLSSLAITLLCANMDVTKGKKIIKSIGKTTFGIYLVHVNSFIWNYVLVDLFAFLSPLNPGLMILGIIGATLAVFLISMVIEYGRIKLFDILKINKLGDLLGSKVDYVVDEVIVEKLK